MYRNFSPIPSLIFLFSFMGLFVKEAQPVRGGLRWVVGSRHKGHGFSVRLRNTREQQRKARGEDAGGLCDLLHCKTGCWCLPSLCFASSRPQSQWSPPGRCSRPPAGGPRWWLWRSTTQGGERGRWGPALPSHRKHCRGWGGEPEEGAGWGVEGRGW